MVDEELEALLDRVASRMIEDRIRTGKCCDRVRDGVVELNSLGGILEAVKTCRVVLVNIYSTNCPYCRSFHIVFEDVASRYNGLAGFYRINIDYHPEIIYRLNIMGTPTTLVFVNGRLFYVIPGLVFHDVLENIIKQALREAGCRDEGRDLYYS